ncbi:glycosyltransferase family 2 protein, partial [Thermogladius sp.]
MADVCVYGTVFNNARYVEESIKSVYRPNYTIVVVDSYSTDGTWEKLLELKRDFNLKLYRYKSSRGLGRQIALRKCPEGSITA